METTEYICAACGKAFKESITLTTEVGKYTGCPHCGCWDYDKKQKQVMTKSQLKQYLHLEREIASMEEQLNEFEKQGKQDTELYEMYHNNLLRCMALRLKIRTFIFNIDDSMIRQIFEARYIKGLTWPATALRINGYYTPDYLRMLHDRYLKQED